VAALAAERQRKAVVSGIVFRHDPAGIEKVGGKALVDQHQGNRARRLGESFGSCASIAERGFKNQIARPVRPYQRRIGRQRRDRADDMRQRLPFDLYGFRGVLRLVQTFGDDKGHRVAHVSHSLARKDRIRRNRNILPGRHAFAGKRSEFADVIGGEDEADARLCPRRGNVGYAKARVGVRRAQHHGMQRSGRRVVGHVAARAAQQRVVLLARDRLTEAEFHRHGGSLRWMCCRPRRR
jgi:hypothetical protein